MAERLPNSIYGAICRSRSGSARPIINPLCHDQRLCHRSVPDKLAQSRTFVQFSSMSFSTIFILLFVAVGVGIAAFGARGVIHARASSAWPQVSGEITHSEITDSDSTYSPLVRYKYSVSDRAFAGERICFGLDRMFAGYKFAQRYTQRYPVGSPVAATMTQISQRNPCSSPALPSAPLFPWRSALDLPFLVVGLLCSVGFSGDEQLVPTAKTYTASRWCGHYKGNVSTSK